VSYLVRQTETFVKWHAGLRDLRVRVAIARRIERIAVGTLGDVKSVGGGISELRVDVGPGYRLYFTMRSGVMCDGGVARGRRQAHAERRYQTRTRAGKRGVSDENESQGQSQTHPLRHGRTSG
jgi:putative addiction module killer protein